MKKIFFIIIVVIFMITNLPTLADELNDTNGIDDILRYTNSVDNAFNGQKKITDEEFQKTLAQVKAKQKKGKKNKPFKGNNFNEENNGGYIQETADKNLLLSVPVELTNGDGADITVGHYKIVGKKLDNSVYLDFYQSSTLIARVPAIETESDFGQSTKNFVKLVPYNEQRVEIIYGSMDFNAYTFVKIKQILSDNN